VLFHCAGGRDRAGLVALLVLALAGVPADPIAADHALTDERLCAFNAAHGRTFTPSDFDYLYSDRGTTPARIISEIVDGTSLGMDVSAYLRSGGATEGDLAAVRRRLRA
ncbi:MAG: tyrosine-protein phosphatase, partial [Nocardioidaceae bacterium]